jgi:hypothetical protein
VPRDVGLLETRRETTCQRQLERGRSLRDGRASNHRKLEPPVRLLDFGVARFYQAPPGTEGAPVTAPGTPLGTPRTSRRSRRCVRRSANSEWTYWAFGVMPHEALRGCRPIQATPCRTRCGNLRVGAITPLEALLPELPQDVTQLVSSMLVRAPERRLVGVAPVTTFVSAPGAPEQSFVRATQERESRGPGSIMLGRF